VAVRPGAARQAVTVGLDRTARLWDLDRGKELRRYAGPALPPGRPGGFTAVAFAPDGLRVVFGSEAGEVWLWHVGGGAPAHRFDGHRGAVAAVAVSPDGRRALSGGADQQVRLWDLEARRLLRAFDGHRKGVTGLAFSPDGRHFASGSQDGTVRVWGLPPQLGRR
jgi:WD40 repeat protein